MTVVLIGCHGVGKTTVGHALAARLAMPFHGEIGREMAEDPVWRPVQIVASDTQDAFDRELFRRELVRDAWAPRLRVVESWHPTNLAYARARGSVLGDLEVVARDVALQGRWRVVPLVASRAALERRQSEPGDLSFFERVAEDAFAEAKALGAELLPLVDTSAASAEATADRIVELLEAKS